MSKLSELWRKPHHDISSRKWSIFCRTPQWIVLHKYSAFLSMFAKYSPASVLWLYYLCLANSQIHTLTACQFFIKSHSSKRNFLIPSFKSNKVMFYHIILFFYFLALIIIWIYILFCLYIGICIVSISLSIYLSIYDEFSKT